MLTSKRNNKLSVIEIFFGISAVIGLNKILVTFSDDKVIYPNKLISILTDKDVVIKGRLIFDKINYYFIPDVPLLSDNDYIYKGVFYDSFLSDINDDDSILPSVMEIKKILLAKPDLIEKDNYLFGDNGLVTGFDKFKLNQNKIKYKNFIFPFNSPIMNNIGNIKIDGSLNHRFKLENKDLNIELEIDLIELDYQSNIELQLQNYNLKVNKFSITELYKNVVLNIVLSRVYSITDEKDYLKIDCKFENVDLNTTDINVYHFISNINDLITNIPLLTNQYISNFKYNDNILSTNSYLSNFYISDNTISFDYNGKNEIKNNSKLIIDGVNIDSIKNPGNYYKHNGNISTIIGKPINQNTRFSLKVENYNLDLLDNKLYLLQRYTTYKSILTTFQLITFERISTYDVNNNFLWCPWIEVSLSGHKHLASDITQSSTLRFVTDTQITAWNNNITSNTVWKNPVNLKTDLFSVYPSPGNGWSCYVNETKSIWTFTINEWLNQKSYASLNTDGILSKNDYKNFFLNPALSKKVDNKESFIHRLTESPETIYGTNFSKISINHIDNVKRTNSLLNTLKEFTIQEGWDVTSYGSKSFLKGLNINSEFNNSIGIGEGLKYTGNNQTFFGKFNDSIDLCFGIGNGINENNRNNLFGVKTNGIVVATGYSTNSNSPNDILLSDGTTINKNTLLQEVYNNISTNKEIILVDNSIQFYTMTWTQARLNNFGKFGSLEVWLFNSNNIYTLENIPIRMETGLDANNNVIALSYEFQLSNQKAIIIIK